MKKIIYPISVIGWILALIVHIISILGVDLQAKFPYVFALHFGVFIVWLPTILALRKNDEIKNYQQASIFNRMNPLGFMYILFRETPNWLRILAISGFVYAIINFALFMNMQEGSPSIRDGAYILQNHGQLIRVLTENEYHRYQANEVRGFSGHWIAFYGIACAVLFPYNNKRK